MQSDRLYLTDIVEAVDAIEAFICGVDFDVKFSDIPVEPHPLKAVIRTRVTNRRAFSRRPLGPREREALEASVGAGYRMLWLEGPAMLRRMARLLFDNVGIRLTTPEAYEVQNFRQATESLAWLLV